MARNTSWISWRLLVHYDRHPEMHTAFLLLACTILC